MKILLLVFSILCLAYSIVIAASIIIQAERERWKVSTKKRGAQLWFFWATQHSRFPPCLPANVLRRVYSNYRATKGNLPCSKHKLHTMKTLREGGWFRPKPGIWCSCVKRLNFSSKANCAILKEQEYPIFLSACCYSTCDLTRDLMAL